MKTTKRLAACAVLAAVLIMQLSGCSKSPADQAQQAMLANERGDHNTAVILLKDSIQREPGNAEYRYLLGTVYDAMTESVSAEKELRKAAEMGLVKGGRVTAELGRAILQQNEFKKLLADISPNAAFEPEPLASIIALRGRAHLALGQKSDATTRYEEAAKVDAAALDVMILRALLEIPKNNLDAAVTLLNEALARYPRSLDALFIKSDLLRTQGKIPDALVVLSTIVEYAPNLLKPRMARAQLLVRLKQPQEAQKDVDAARKFSGNSPFLTYTQALIYFNLGKLREAYATVQLSLRMAPDYRPAQLLYAALSYSTGALGQAEQALTELARDFPQDAYVRKLLAATLIARRDGKRALEVIEPMLSKDLLDTVVMEIAGDAYMAAGEYDKAALYMERAAASDPKNARLRMGVAMVRLSAGEVDKAVGDLEAAAKLEGGAERAKVILILTHLTSGKYDKALEEAHSLLEKQPKEPLAHFLLGAVYAGKKDDAQARASFERSLALRADYLPAAEKLARMDMAEKKLDAAQKTMEAALAASKDNIQAIILLSEILAAKGDTNAAVAMLERARKASKGAIEPRARLAAYYARTGDNAKALEIAQETLSANPDNPAALQLVGMARTMAGDTNSAQAVLAKAVAADPKSAQARNNLAAAQVAGGRLADAEANYRKAIELQPEFLGARLALCALLIKTQRPDEALGMVPEMRKKYPKSADVHMLEGDALMQKKKYPEALQAYESALSLAPSGALAAKVYMARARARNADTALAWLAGWVKDNPQNHEARSYLADGLLVVGQTKAAVEHYDYLVQKAPGDAMALNNLANALSRLKDPRALDTAEKAYKLVPNNPLVADTLGWLLLEQGDKARAVELLRKAAASGLPEIRYHLGAGLARTGDKTGARKQLEDLLKSGAPFPQKKEAEALLRQL